MTTFAVLGSGGWGTAIAILLAQNPAHRVRLWGAHAETVRRLRDTRENTRLLPGVRIPSQCRNHRRSGRKRGGGRLLGVRDSHRLFARHHGPVRGRPGRRCASSEPDEGTGDRHISPAARKSSEKCSGPKRLAALSGPSHAEEVARGLPTSVVVASADRELAERAQEHFGTDRFRVYTNTDLLGVELAGALKNVVGIAAGVCDGLGFGDNAKAALLTRGHG